MAHGFAISYEQRTNNADSWMLIAKGLFVWGIYLIICRNIIK
jgi:hypothetical protein